MVAVYTGFAIVLTTLIWVYLSWLILLIGAQLAFYVQFPQYLAPRPRIALALEGRRARAGSACPIMYLDRARLPPAACRIGARRASPRNSMFPGRGARAACSPILERAALLAATEKE